MAHAPASEDPGTRGGPVRTDGRAHLGGPPARGIVSDPPAQRRAGSRGRGLVRVRTTLDEAKDDLIDKVAALAASRKGTGSPPGEAAAGLVRSFYRHVASEDIAERSEDDLYGGAISQYRLAQHRPQGTANIRVFTPSVAEHGWSAAGHTVVEVVTDDMPFLVDSVTMELNEQNRAVHIVIHPQLLVRRDLTGQVAGRRDVQEPPVVGSDGRRLRIPRGPPHRQTVRALAVDPADPPHDARIPVRRAVRDRVADALVVRERPAVEPHAVDVDEGVCVVVARDVTALVDPEGDPPVVQRQHRHARSGRDRSGALVVEEGP